MHRNLGFLLVVVFAALALQPVSSKPPSEPIPASAAEQGKVVELDESNFESAISTFDFILVDFYAPWCGHCKRLNPQLDAAAPQLAKLDKPILIAKLDADKYRRLATKYEIDGFPTLKLFMHGVPIEYSGPRKPDLLVRFLKKFVAPDVQLLESDSAITKFVETSGTYFPIYIAFGLDETLISEFAVKYKKKAWFSSAKDFSEDVMITYDFDKVPALVSLHPSYNERSVFYGPFQGDFLEDFIRQSLVPLAMPINYDTLKLLNDDDREIVLTIVEDETDEKSLALIKLLRAAASANRDLVFGYVGVKQWEDFVETFEVNKKTELPKMIVWNRNDEYISVIGSERLVDEDQGSQITLFLEGYRNGRTVKSSIGGASLFGYINSLVSMRTVYLIVFVVAVLMLIQTVNKPDEDDLRRTHVRADDVSDSTEEREAYRPEDKED